MVQIRFRSPVVRRGRRCHLSFAPGLDRCRRERSTPPSNCRNTCRLGVARNRAGAGLGALPARGAERPPRRARLAIGDSHTWLAGACSQYPHWDWRRPDRTRLGRRGDCPGARAFRRRHTAVIFDLATNDADDPAGFGANLRLVWRTIGPDRSLVLVTGWRIDAPENRDGLHSVDRKIKRFAAHHPKRVAVVDWGQASTEAPTVLRAGGERGSLHLRRVPEAYGADPRPRELVSRE